MASVAGLRIVQCLYGMDLPEIGPVGFGYVARAIIRYTQIRINAAALVTVEAELLIMAVRAVLSSSARKEAVFPHLIGSMSRSNT